jgi:hypothetical protein
LTADLDGCILRAMAAPMREKSDPRRPTRELVRSLLAEGKRPADIAAILGLTRARVYQHIRRLRQKEEP